MESTRTSGNGADGKKSYRRQKTAQFPDLEKNLVEFVVDRRSRGIGVSTIEVHLKVNVLAKVRSNNERIQSSTVLGRCLPET